VTHVVSISKREDTTSDVGIGVEFLVRHGLDVSALNSVDEGLTNSLGKLRGSVLQEVSGHVLRKDCAGDVYKNTNIIGADAIAENWRRIDKENVAVALVRKNYVVHDDTNEVRNSLRFH